MTQERNARAPEALDASPRLFENDTLDKMSRVHHLTPVIIYTPIILGLVFYAFTIASAHLVIVSVLLGYIGWTLTEYFGHRFLFHTIFPLPFGLGPHFQYLIHGVHHVYPNDPLRLVMPPLLSAPIMLIALAIIYLIFGSTLMWPALAGFIAGYVIYDCVHYWTHHSQPQTELGKLVKRLHMLHHFRDSEKGFGVHAIWWDYVFNTAYRKDETPGSNAV